MPLLKKYDMTAVLAILGGVSDQYTADTKANPKAKYPNLTWTQIKELHESGHAEIQSHSYDLHTVPIGSGKKKGESKEAYHARLLENLQKLQQACADNLDGYAPNTYLFPLGVIGEGSREVLNELGFIGSVSCQEGMNTLRQGDPDCLFGLLRTNRPSGRSIGEILQKIKA